MYDNTVDNFSSLIVDVDDLRYFRDKVARATTPEAKIRAEKQLAIIEDCIIIYKCSHVRKPTS